VPPPVDLASLSNVNFHCSPAASVEPDGTFRVGAVTATASFRFSRWLTRWFELSGSKVIIGKGGMSEHDYKEHFVPNEAVYLTTVGYGTGALLGRGVKRVRDVYWLEEMGIAQALWVFEVERFGPFLVESDLKGNGLFEREGRLINAGTKHLYDGLRQPALRRYGETTSRQDEVI
jgi:L(+)-tartrate dehydratase beta subunit